MAVIETHGLTRRFGDLVAVDDLDLSVEEGTVFGVLGHNGAGKTTMVRLLNGVLAASAGSARVLGMSPVEQGAELRRRTGVLTETPSLEDRLTGRENLALYAELYDVPVKGVSGRVAELLEAFGLAERGDDKAGGYSRGMRQRLALARSLLHKPELLFLDEPTSSLDPVAARQVHDLVRQMVREEQRTILLCTHNLAEAQQLCDQVAVLEHGRLVALGTPRELVDQLGRRGQLEIEVAPGQEPMALAALAREMRDLPGIAEEPGIIVVPGADRESIPSLIEALIDAEIQLYRVTPKEATLADVYFALHDQMEAGRR